MSQRNVTLTPYEEVIQVLEDLPTIVRHTRRARNQSLREAGREAGVSFPTIKRVESGDHEMDTKTAKALLRWAL